MLQMRMVPMHTEGGDKDFGNGGICWSLSKT